MPDKHTPKISLFSWLPEPCLQGGPLKRWRDVICKDLKARADTTHREQYRKQADNQAQCPECFVFGPFAETVARRGTSAWQRGRNQF